MSENNSSDGGKIVINVKQHLNLVGRMTALITNFANRVVHAPTGYKKIAGQKCATVWEVKKQFTTALAELAEIAELVGDEDALNLAKAQVGRDEQDVKDLENKIRNLGNS